MCDDRRRIRTGAILSAGLVAMALWVSPPTLCDESPRTASYRGGLEIGDFLKTWLLLGPIAPGDGGDAEAFTRDWLAGCGGETGTDPRPEAGCEIDGKEHAWRLVRSEGDIVDLAESLGPKTQTLAYAWAEIQAEEPTKFLLGIGSDDGVKAWLNGAVIHENRTGRPVTKDEDLVAVVLQKGRNRLLLKIQNQQGDWGFACRRLGPEELGEKMLDAVGMGNLEAVQQLLDHGVDVNAKLKYGVRLLDAARIRGYEEIAAFLRSRGADATLEMAPPEKLADAVLSEVVGEDSPGVAVLVSRGGKVLFEKGYGYASLEHRIPVTTKTKFRIGSITKQFTAAAILQLEERGKLSVKDPLSKFLPDFPRGEEVTVHHLLTHTSGIKSYTDKPDFLKTATMPVEPEELIDSFRNDPYDFAPGEGWRYSNSGYFLLGHIVEKVSGESFSDYLRKNLFEPLGMKDTGIHRATDILRHEATGYAQENGKVKKALDWDMSRAGGAGALYSTVEDLHRWNEALFGGKVLAKETLEAAFTPVELKEGVEGLSYGYGWGIWDLRGLKVIGHSGGLHGFLSQLSRYPEKDLTVAVLANCSPPMAGLVPDAIAQQLAEGFLWREMKPRKAQVVDESVEPEHYDAYVGEYDYGTAIMTVTKEGTRLFAQLTGQPRFEIFPRSENEFFWKVVDAQVTFVKDDQGKVLHAAHRQSGQEFKAPKLEGREVAEVDPAIYDAYVGEYDYGGGAVLTVTKEGNRLFAQLTGQAKFEILPSSEREFFWKVVNARVTFVKDASDKVVKARHRQGGKEFEAPRLR